MEVLMGLNIPAPALIGIEILLILVLGLMIIIGQ